MPSASPDTLIPVDLKGFGPNFVRIRSQQTTRLVVFLHGFEGHPIETWGEFPKSVDSGDWWNQSDLLFLGYHSRKLEPTGVADVLRRLLGGLFPVLPEEWTRAGDTAIRPPSTQPLSELVLVGHSLGGVVARRLMADVVSEWNSAGQPPSAHQRAKLRLFSPATGGFLPSGPLGAVNAVRTFRRLLEISLSSSPSWHALQPMSRTLTDLERDTTQLAAEHPHLEGLRASTLWANPDDVVSVVRYEHDPPSFTQPFAMGVGPGGGHSKICKPDPTYREPWEFVESGKLS